MYVYPYQDPYAYNLSTSEVFPIHSESVAIILTSSTISTIRIYIYSTLNILLVGLEPHLVTSYIECDIV